MAAFIDKTIIARVNVSGKTLRNNLIPLKVGIFIWRVLKERVAVKTELVKRGVNLSSIICPMCNKEAESTNHALLSCDLATDVWTRIHRWWNQSFNHNSCIGDILQAINHNTMPTALLKMWQAITWTTTYFIWKNRNQKVFNDDSWSAAKIVCDIQEKSYVWIMNRSRRTRKDWLQWILNPINLGVPDVYNLDPG
ncbi:uncharacterized protein [Rutidosis leptorrhynchoides]|uniref:uncharacterized protein n=1 Tax=Rutidosis leptorrhynchoides TaxID=125765 RepID=UPI003A9905DB